MEKVKRIRLLDAFLLCLANSKIVFKEPKDSKHYTLKILPEGILDFHETIEGKDPLHRSLMKLDLKKFAEEMKEIIERKLPNIMKEIDITDPSYEDTNVILVSSVRTLDKSIEVRRREITIGENTLRGIASPVPMKDLQSYDFKTAFLEHGDKEYTLLKIAGKYFLLNIDDLMPLFEKALEQSKC